jgi:RNA-binding protein YlmH
LFAPALPSCSLGDIVMTADLLHIVTLPGLEGQLALYQTQALATWPGTPASVQRVTAASPRLDAITGAMFHVSREEAQTAIEYGFVFLNFQSATKRSKQVAAGDVLVYRGKGRALVVGCELNPRSKRQWVDFELFPC